MIDCSEKPKKIKLLDEQSYLIFLNHAPDGIGHTHQAMISDGIDEHYVYASLYQPATHPKSLVNEITAYLLATALNLPVAPHAFIVAASAIQLKAIYPAVIFSDEESHIPLWCISSLSGSSPKFHYNLHSAHINTAFQADIGAWPQVLDAIVFDDWLGNGDRNTGNLIRTEKSRYSLIDHEDIIGHRSWRAERVDPNADIANKLAVIMWGGYAINDSKKTNAMIHFADNAMPANISVLQELVYWWKLLLTPEELVAAHRFIMKRATICPERIKRRYGSLI